MPAAEAAMGASHPHTETGRTAGLSVTDTGLAISHPHLENRRLAGPSATDTGQTHPPASQLSCPRAMASTPWEPLAMAGRQPGVA